MMYKKLFAFVFYLLVVNLSAQSKLKIVPEEIRFTDKFHRLVNVYFINEGNEPLSLDSLYYSKGLYYMRFDRRWEYPLIINPGDSLQMDCILSRYNMVTYDDTEDSLFIYRDDHYSEKIKIKIDFYNNNIGWGKVKGNVKSQNYNLARAVVYCYADGRYLYDSTYSDINGNYEIDIPEGTYTLAAVKERHNLTFVDNKLSPLNPTYRYIKRDSVVIADFNLTNSEISGKSISGRIFERLTKAAMRRAILIVRKGKHNADKKSKVYDYNFDEEVYSALANSDGYYNIPVKTEGYYHIQGFSDYHMPGYYSESGTTFFWQQADTINVDSDITAKDIFFTRDSSFGAGIISGRVSVQSLSGNEPISNIIILVKSLTSDSFISYGLAREDGYFRIVNLPYGNYQLIAQKIGLKDASSIIISIDSTNYKRDGISINLNVLSVDEGNSPVHFTLLQNYPNPFNPVTMIKYSINQRNNNNVPVQLSIFNLIGEEIATLINENQPAGNYQVNFEASSVSGGLSSGIYFYQLKAGEFIQTRKMIYLK